MRGLRDPANDGVYKNYWKSKENPKRVNFYCSVKIKNLVSRIATKAQNRKKRQTDDDCVDISTIPIFNDDDGSFNRETKIKTWSVRPLLSIPIWLRSDSKNYLTFSQCFLDASFCLIWRGFM